MGILILFLKLLLIGIGIISLWLFLDISWTFLLFSWKTKKSTVIFKEHLSRNIYDEYTIKRAVKYYSSPKYQNEHPYRKKKRRDSTPVPIKKQDLTKRVDMFLDLDLKYRNLLILADSGMGKTCFSLNYFIHNYDRKIKKTHKLVLVPLNAKNADKEILSQPNKSSTCLFLDGFDEDIKAAVNSKKRIQQLMNLSHEYKKVIITCSTDFFPKDPSMQKKVGYERIGPENKSDNHYYEFRKIYMSIFNVTDARKYINFRFSIFNFSLKKRIQLFMEESPQIKITPFFLNHSKGIQKKGPYIPSINYLYEKITEKWLHNETKGKDTASLSKFIQRLAENIYLDRANRGTESITEEDLAKNTNDWGTPLHQFENNYQSLTNKTRTGSFKFAHRSVMEYLFIRRLLSGAKSCYQVPLTNQMIVFLLEQLASKNPAKELKAEFDWLSKLNLMAYGLKAKSSNANGVDNIYKTVLSKNKQFDFLTALNVFIHNPIFYEFGWDTKLNINLEKAINQEKSSVMKYSKKKWTVMIHPNYIEITKQYQKDVKILINKKDVKEYSSLPKNTNIIRLSRAIGLKGLIQLNNINQSKKFCILPDLKTFKKFTLYFWVN